MNDYYVILEIPTSRFKKYGIGIGLGKRSFDNSDKMSPGPGDYNLPSLFKKGRQGKYPLNWSSGHCDHPVR